MSWQGAWAGQSNGRWYGYTVEEEAAEVLVAAGSMVFAPFRRPKRPALAEAQLSGVGAVRGDLTGPRGRRHREEEALLSRSRTLH